MWCRGRCSRYRISARLSGVLYTWRIVCVLSQSGNGRSLPAVSQVLALGYISQLGLQQTSIKAHVLLRDWVEVASAIELVGLRCPLPREFYTTDHRGHRHSRSVQWSYGDSERIQVAQALLEEKSHLFSVGRPTQIWYFFISGIRNMIVHRLLEASGMTEQP